MPTLSTTQLTKLSHILAQALAVDEVNQIGRDTGQAQRLRPVTPHRLFLAVVSTLGSGRVESLADLLPFPGRFTTIEPAAVEVHATYSGFADEVRRVQMAPDAKAERPFLPDPATLTNQLLLADRGYPSVADFEAVAAQGGAFIVRLTRSYDP